MLETAEDRGSVRDQARLTCLYQPYAGAWLNVAPRPALSLHLRATEFFTTLRLQRGADVFSSAGPSLACPAPSDQLGDHDLCCAFQGERFASHNALPDALHATAAAAALSPFKESRFLLPGSGRKPADIFLPCWSAGKDTAWYITVTPPAGRHGGQGRHHPQPRFFRGLL
jgi:hypothetical protein